MAGVLWSDLAGPDAFNFVGGGYYGDVVTFGSTTPVTSSQAGGGACFIDARFAGTAWANKVAIDSASLQTTNTSTNAAQLNFIGPSTIANAQSLTFANSNTGAASTASPYQFQGDVTNQKNVWTTGNETITGIITSNNATASTSTAGAIYVPNGGISSLNSYVQNTSNIGSVVTSNTTDTTVANTSPNQFNGSVGFNKSANFAGVATFNQPAYFNSTVYMADGSAFKVKQGQDLIADNIITINGVGLVPGNDSGINMARNQTANDAGTGDVVNDNAQGQYLNGTVASGSNSTTVINLGQTMTTAQQSNLPGMWIKVVDPANPTVIMTRRIKSVTTAGLVTIWATADNVAGTDTTDAVTYGKDFTNVPSASMTYTIWSRSFMEMCWVEAAKRFRMGSTPQSANSPLSYLTSLADFEASNIWGLSMNTNQINPFASGQTTNLQGVSFLGTAISNISSINGNPAPSTPVQVTLNDGSTTAVSIPGLTVTSGVVRIIVSSVSATGSRFVCDLVSNGSSSAVSGNATAGYTASATINERVAVQWVSGQSPQLYHRVARSPSSNVGLVYNVNYIIYA
jgi:hypothetical protein